MAEPENPEIRASDSDREAVVERLRAAQADGRLTLTEYDQRIQAAYAALTMGDLSPLTSDLPAPRTVEKRKWTMPSPARMPGAWKAYARTAFLLVGIWAVTSIGSGHVTPFWPIFPLGIWGIVLVSQTVFGDSGSCDDQRRNRDRRDRDTDREGEHGRKS